MACKGFLECLLKLFNLLLTVAGLAMVGYGIYLFLEYQRTPADPVGSGEGLVQLGRPMLMAVSLNESFVDKLPKAWFIYLFIGVGVVLFVISCFGCVGSATRNGCCLTCYAVLLILLILVELSCAAFIFFDKNWKAGIPTDKTGYFDMIYDFLEDNWDIVRWVALGIVIFEALVFLLALMVRCANAPPDYDSDEEFIAPRRQINQPLLNNQTVPAVGALDQRPSRNDAWSIRMREKYGLDTSEFSYDQSRSNRFQQVSAQPAEERSRCTIM